MVGGADHDVKTMRTAVSSRDLIQSFYRLMVNPAISAAVVMKVRGKVSKSGHQGMQ